MLVNTLLNSYFDKDLWTGADWKVDDKWKPQKGHLFNRFRKLKITQSYKLKILILT